MLKKEGDKMNYIGEFQKNSTILLELLTKGKENQPIPVDYPPVAVIEHYERNGVIEVDNVTLETMEDSSTHKKSYLVSSDLKAGKYLITYKATINSVEYTTQEEFDVKPTELIKVFDLDSSEGEEDEVIESAEGYVASYDYQSPSKVEVIGQRLIITLSDAALYNHTYRVVLDQNIKSEDGNHLSSIKTLTFTSEYKPLYSTPLEVRSVLRGMFKYFTPHDIYAAIRDAGQKSLQLKGSVVDANNPRYRDMRDTDASLFPTQKYVMYEASRMLMTGLLVRFISGVGDDEVDGGLGMMDTGGGSIALGDFSVSDSASSSSDTNGGRKKEETPLEKLQKLIEQTERELKFWMDAMMGHNRRGYAKPITGSFRTDAGSPEGRDFG